MNIINRDINTSEGYVFPFEGERHSATVVMLPYRKDTWRNDASFALDEFYDLVETISHFEPVLVVIDPRIDSKTVRRFSIPNTVIYRLRYNDSWARDIAPVFMINDKEELLALDFGFNAWGGEYDGLYKDYEDDNRFGKNIALDLAISRYPRKDFILEGGSVLTDGRGTILTTECCLLSKGRNPSLSKEEIEHELLTSLNARKVIFLPDGIYEDETDGHVDNIASFLDPHTIALAVTDDENDPQYALSNNDLAVLENATDADGNKYNIVKLPLPKPLYLQPEEEIGLEKNDEAIDRIAGRRLAASYCNLYQGEDFVIVPKFNVEEDEIAFKILSDFYQGKKKVIQLYSREILLGGGNIHCVTKEIPYSSLKYPFKENL